MACGCARSKIYTQQHPLVIGDPNAVPAAQYRTSITFMGIKANATFWATGSGVGPMVSAGWLTAL